MPTEYCSCCETETDHNVALEIREESDHDDASRRAFSREPYRIATCQACETETATRMNNVQSGTSA